MKHLRFFENGFKVFYFSQPNRGDFVICDEDIISNNKRLIKLNNFLLNNIGKIVSDVPSSPTGYFSVYYSNYKDDLELIDFFNNPYTGCRQMSRKEIKYFGKTKDELQMKIDASKYNL